MQQILYLNFDGKNSQEIFDISKQRIDEILGMLADISVSVLKNKDSFSFISQHEETKDLQAMHKGKILKEMLSKFDDFQEKIFIISIFEGMLDVLQGRMPATLIQFQTLL